MIRVHVLACMSRYGLQTVWRAFESYCRHGGHVYATSGELKFQMVYLSHFQAIPVGRHFHGKAGGAERRPLAEEHG